MEAGMLKTGHHSRTALSIRRSVTDSTATFAPRAEVNRPKPEADQPPTDAAQAVNRCHAARFGSKCHSTSMIAQSTENTMNGERTRSLRHSHTTSARLITSGTYRHW